MKNIIVKGSILVVLTITTFSILIGQGLYWETISKNPNANGKEIHTKVCHMPHMFKSSTEEQTIIERLDKEMYYQINSQKKEYLELTFEEMHLPLKKFEATQNEKIKDLLKNLPPDQRDMIEKKIMEQKVMEAGTENIGVVKTTERKTICGYLCMKFVLTDHKKEIGSVWSTADVPNFNSIQKDREEIGLSMAGQISMDAVRWALWLHKINGFIMQMTTDGTTSTIIKVEEKTIAPSEFEVPAGLKKVDQKEFLKG